MRSPLLLTSVCSLLAPSHTYFKPGRLSGMMSITFVSHKHMNGRQFPPCHVSPCTYGSASGNKPHELDQAASPLLTHSLPVSNPRIGDRVADLCAVRRTSIRIQRRPASSWPCSSVWVWSWSWMKWPQRPGEAGAVSRRSQSLLSPCEHSNIPHSSWFL